MCKTGEKTYSITFPFKTFITGCTIFSFVLASILIIDNYIFPAYASTSYYQLTGFGNVTNHTLINDSKSEEKHKESLFYQLKIGNTIYPIAISSNGRQVNNLLFDRDENDILLILEPPLTNKTHNNGTLIVDIPRTILDSQVNNMDQNYTVTIDGQPTKYIENFMKINASTNSTILRDNTTKSEALDKTNDIRELVIEFTRDSKIIEITGTDISSSDQDENRNEQIMGQDIPIKINNKTKFITMFLDGADLDFSQFESNPKNKSFLFSIIPNRENGTLIVDIPRTILDSQVNNMDQNYTVTIDGQPTKYIENFMKINASTNSTILRDNTTKSEALDKTNDIRELVIEFTRDSKIIEITGTDIHKHVNNSNKTIGKIDIVSNPSSESFGEQQTFLIATVSASTGVAAAVIYFLYNKKKIKLFRGSK